MSIINWLFEKSDKVLTRLCDHLGDKTEDKKTFYTEGSPYLSRFYLRRRRNHDTAPEESSDTPQGLLSVYLHYFHRGDEDDALHNHPWGYSFSLVLTNGYIEERWTGNGIKKRTIRPGSTNIIRSDDFHRVDLIDPTKGAWTLFFAGPRVQDWGFWHPKHQQNFMPSWQFIRNRDPNALSSSQN